MKIFLHELFIETTAVLWNAHNYEAINYFTSVPYINYFSYKNDLSNFKDVFYSLSDTEIYSICQFLGRYLYNGSNKGFYYHSGLAEYWLRNIPVKFINKNDFVNADCLLTNISLITAGDSWFALSYMYLINGESEVIKEIGISLKSRKLAKDYYLLFDTDKEAFIESLKVMNDISQNYELRLSYNGVFNAIPLISNYIKIDEVESLK